MKNRIIILLLAVVFIWGCQEITTENNYIDASLKDIKGFKVDSYSANSAEFSWIDNVVDEEYFKIEVYEFGNKLVIEQQFEANSTSGIINYNFGTGAYRFKLSAYGAGVTSVVTDQLYCTVARPEITNINFDLDDPTAINVDWSYNYYYKEFKIYKKVNGGSKELFTQLANPTFVDDISAYSEVEYEILPVFDNLDTPGQTYKLGKIPTLNEANVATNGYANIEPGFVYVSGQKSYYFSGRELTLLKLPFADPTPQIVNSIEEYRISKLTGSANDGYLAYISNDDDTKLHFFSTESNSVTDSINLGSETVNALVFYNGSSKALIGTASGKLYFVSRTGGITKTVDLGTEVNNIEVNLGKNLFYILCDNSKLKVYSMSNLQETEEVTFTSTSQTNNKIFYVSGVDKLFYASGSKLEKYNTESLQLVSTYNAETDISSLCKFSDSKLFIAEANEIKIYNLTSNSIDTEHSVSINQPVSQMEYRNVDGTEKLFFIEHRSMMVSTFSNEWVVE